MRTELLIKRRKIKKEVDELNKLRTTKNKKKSFEIGKQREKSKEKYQFINNLLKVIKWTGNL